MEPKQQYENVFEHLNRTADIVSGQMFGKACLKINGGKAFAAFFQDCMVFKLGQEAIRLHVEKYPGSINWDPSGKNRAMKDWLQVPFDYKDKWEMLAREALEFDS